MSKKIVILNGSPRLNGNTKGLIEAFTKGAESQGHNVKCFDLQTMNIRGCLGCFGLADVLLGIFRTAEMYV